VCRDWSTYIAVLSSVMDDSKAPTVWSIAAGWSSSQTGVSAAYTHPYMTRTKKPTAVSSLHLAFTIEIGLLLIIVLSQ